MKHFVKLVSVFGFCFVILSLASCSKEPAEGMIKVTNDSVDYEFECPADFAVTRSDAMIAVTKKDSRDNFSVTSFAISDPDFTMDAYVEKYTADLLTVYKAMIILRDDEITLDDAKARRLSYTAELGDGSYSCEMVLCARGANLYTILFTASPDSYEQTVDDFNYALSTFRFQ